MSENKKTAGTGTYIGLALALILIILLANPAILPLPAEMKEKLAELEKTHFLIERSGRITIAHIITLVLAMCVLWVCYNVIKLILNAISRNNERLQTVMFLILGVLKYLSFIIAIIWGLSILGVNSTAVVAGAGIIGLIVGFGAQSLIEDVLTGFFIIFEGKYKIGDIIILDDFRGTVRDIGVRTTTIEDAGHNLKVVNNSDIRNFQNRSANSSIAACEVSVSYDTDLAALEKMLAENLPKMYAVHKDLYLSQPKYLGVTALADSGVNLKFIVEATEQNVFSAQRTLTRDIRILFADKNVEIPFPQVVVHNAD